jgi:hypothetical protein
MFWRPQSLFTHLASLPQSEWLFTYVFLLTNLGFSLSLFFSPGTHLTPSLPQHKQVRELSQSPALGVRSPDRRSSSGSGDQEDYDQSLDRLNRSLTELSGEIKRLSLKQQEEFKAAQPAIPPQVRELFFNVFPFLCNVCVCCCFFPDACVGLVSTGGRRVGPVIERSLVRNPDWTVTIFFSPITINWFAGVSIM